jgi:hypothetical protein|tara:strand:- start:313 stop:516 length:204 start_codon:yes stop_codon:yes gene_type:complete
VSFPAGTVFTVLFPRLFGGSGKLLEQMKQFEEITEKSTAKIMLIRNNNLAVSNEGLSDLSAFFKEAF